MVSTTRYEDLKRWKRAGKWVLVYGRRKTGKSYFVKNFVFLHKEGEEKYLSNIKVLNKQRSFLKIC